MAYDASALIVDDDTHVRSFLSILVRKIISGTITEASNGRDAVEAYERVRPSLVLLDVNMPIVDGMTALPKIREIDPNAVIIMLTSLAMRRVVQDALDLGASNFIRKDTPKDQIVQIISETIEDVLNLSPGNPPAAASPVATSTT